MIHFITYCDNKIYKYSKRNLCRQARKSGWFDTVTAYGPEDLDDGFKQKHASILEQPRGAGCWIWKPHVIQKRLSEINDGDVLVYADAGCVLDSERKNRFDDYLAMLDNPHGLVLFQSDLVEKHLTVKEIFEHFGVDFDGEIANSGQAVAGILLLKKQQASVAIIDEWCQTLDTDALLFTDHYNKNQIEGFHENRHDQSILSVICKKRGYAFKLSERELITPAEILAEGDVAAGTLPLRLRSADMPKTEGADSPIRALRRKAYPYDHLINNRLLFRGYVKLRSYAGRFLAWFGLKAWVKERLWR